MQFAGESEKRKPTPPVPNPPKKSMPSLILGVMFMRGGDYNLPSGEPHACLAFI